MIDLCCHILPSLDGCAPYMDASVKMAEMAIDGGTQLLVTAPVSGDGTSSIYSSYDPHRLSDLYQSLVEQTLRSRLPLSLRSGMLIHALESDQVIRGLKDGYLFPIEDTSYVMLDLSGLEGRYLDDFMGLRAAILHMTRGLKETGFKPLYTCPELMDVFVQEPDFCLHVIEEGGAFLAGKRGLLGRYGDACRDALMYMIGQGYISAIASFGIHFDFDTPHMGQVWDLLSLEFGEQVASYLLEINPDHILADRQPEVFL